MIISISQMTFGYPGRTLFSNLNLRMERPISRLTIVGASGCGKTSFLHLLAGHLRPTSGSISVCESEVLCPDASRALVFQDQNLLPWQSVLENAAFGLKCLGYDKPSRISEATRLLTEVGLEHCLNWSIDRLSGGMKQRVGIARALALRPQCLLMDEPFSALDQLTKESLLQQLLVVTTTSSTKVILVTHDLVDAARFGEVTLVIKPGGGLHVFDWQNIDSHCIEVSPEHLGRRVTEIREQLLDRDHFRQTELESFGFGVEGGGERSQVERI